MSRNPASFEDLLTDGERAKLPPVAITAQLRLPENTAHAVPLVITSIGSGGFASGREALYAEAFTAAGIAMLAIDSFGPRGFTETRTDQGRLSIPASCADAIYALEYMSRDPRIDASRIALFGYSRGGAAVLMSNHEPLQRALLGTGTRFAAYMGLYPTVWLRWERPQPTGGPILTVLAERDDMAPLDRQQDRLAELTAAGANVEAVIIPGVGHSFDAVYPASWRDGSNRCNWDIAVADDGTMRETTSGVAHTGDWAGFLRAIKSFRNPVGGTTGHGGASRTVAIGTLLDFTRRAFAMG